jgi:hypothetical protein
MQISAVLNRACSVARRTRPQVIRRGRLPVDVQFIHASKQRRTYEVLFFLFEAM